MFSISSERAADDIASGPAPLLGRLAEALHAAVAGVAMQPAVLHDHREAVRPDEDREIGKRVALDQQQVGERARLDNSKLALVPHEIASDGGGGAQSLGGRIAEELDEMAYVACVLAHGC